MGEKSKIEWTDHTFNPWMGCQPVSPGCSKCYAEAICVRYRHAEWGPHATRNRTSVEYWNNPMRWDRRAAAAGSRDKVFCASLADVFDNAAPQEWRADLFKLIKATPNLDWLLLSKRPENIKKMLSKDWGNGYRNVWLGITTESQDYYESRWPVLAAIPAKVRFLSYEPALGPLVLHDGPQPNWLICGGESGRGARIMDPTWARTIRDDCDARGIAFFMKQWGDYQSNPIVFEQGLNPKIAGASDPKTNGKGGGLLDGEMLRAFPGEAA